MDVDDTSCYASEVDNWSPKVPAGCVCHMASRDGYAANQHWYVTNKHRHIEIANAKFAQKEKRIALPKYGVCVGA
jgi:hypothetical protein